MKCFVNVQNTPFDKTKNVLTLLARINADIILACLLPICFYQPPTCSSLSYPRISEFHKSLEKPKCISKFPKNKMCFAVVYCVLPLLTVNPPESQSTYHVESRNQGTEQSRNSDFLETKAQCGQYRPGVWRLAVLIHDERKKIKQFCLFI